MNAPDKLRQTSPAQHGKTGGLPVATTRKRKWTLSAIWVVPIVAALVAGYLVLGHLQDYGPMITIRFKDASGVRTEQTDIQYRGMSIGQVNDIQLSTDRQYVLVRARLQRTAAGIARQGSEFWIVRLQNGSLANLGAAVGTVFSGPYIKVLPGSGPPVKEFVGLEQPPVVQERGALHIVLHASNVGSIRPGTPVMYRGVEVGAVQDFQFNSAATAVDIHATVRPQYAHLVHTNSHFRNVSGIRAHLGLFKGLRISVESLRTLVSGGIEFSSPKGPHVKPARNGMGFSLNAGLAGHNSDVHHIHPFRHG
jgi:paraquat-inducible protein B